MHVLFHKRFSPYKKSITFLFYAIWFADLSAIYGANQEKVFNFPSRTDSEVAYGHDLIVHTAKYLGPNGTVGNYSNGMNCQNCHLNAGTKPYGISLQGAFRHFPDYRARIGKVISLVDRVNECIQRPLNGKPLPIDSREMIAITLYLRSIASRTPIGSSDVGENLSEVIKLPERAADPHLGEGIYRQQCESCHGKNGEGLFDRNKVEYVNPPLWGAHSFSKASNMHRLTKLAAFIKANMPFQGSSGTEPKLTDEEAFNVAAFIIDDDIHPRPENPFQKEDYPHIEEKFVDFDEGPWVDPFPAKQHKYGPFPPILKYLREHGNFAGY